MPGINRDNLEDVGKLVKNWVETSEEIWDYVAAVGEFENGGQKPLGPGERAQKNLKIWFLEKVKEVCVCVCVVRCRRIDVKVETSGAPE